MASYYNGRGQSVKIAEDDIHVITSKCPTLYITSETDYADVTADEYVDGTMEFVDKVSRFKIPIEFKLQGHSSIVYPKHNFKIKFYKPDESGDKQKIFFNDWYGIKKCVIKANYRDYSQGINSITAQIVQDWLTSDYPCGSVGVIMSFPCIVFYNGEFMGTHSFNTDQDGDTYGFSKKLEKNLTQGAWRNGDNGNYTPSNWEYKGSEDITDKSKITEALTVFNQAELTKAQIEATFNKNSLINYLMMTQIISGLDRFNNNLTLVTWDSGESWYFTFYDMDTSLGGGGGTDYIAPDNPNIARVPFWHQVATLYQSEYPTYYAKFRDGGMTADAIAKRYENYIMSYGLQNYDADWEKWYSSETKITIVERIESMKTKITERIAYLDELYDYSDLRGD